MNKFTSLFCALMLVSTLSTSATFAGQLSAAQQQALTQMSIQVFGGAPTREQLGPNGVYHGASITASLGEQPAGRHDCEPVDAKGNVVNGKTLGTFQRWRCPHLDK